MKRKHFYKTILLKLVVLVFPFLLKAQELHFADISSMQIWYNQSLKMNAKSDLRLNYRDVKYQSLVAFKTASALVNIPIKSKLGKQSGSNSFFNITAGGTFDQSNAGVFKNNTFLLGFSFAQQLSNNQTFLAIGFQGSSTRSVFGMTNVRFPDQFDQYGPLPNSTRDPLNAGRTYNWGSFNAGISIFQNTATKSWYVGASLRHLNRPYTDEFKSSAYRLAPSLGFQAGLTIKNDMDELGVYGLANWQSTAYEYLLGTRFNKVITKADANSNGTSIGAGIALRVRDAIIPNIQIQFNKTTIGIHYDLNISGLKASGYSRQSIEMAITQQIN